MIKLMISTLFCFAISISAASSFESNSEKYAKEMAKYEQTGEFKRCIRNSDIRRTKVLDDTHIIFEMRNKKFFLNSLNNRCVKLGFAGRFAYSVSGNRICSKDLIAVLDLAGSSCSLGQFEILKKSVSEDVN